MPERNKLKPFLQIRIMLLTIMVTVAVLGISDTLSTLSSVRALEDEIGSQTSLAASRMAADLRRSTTTGVTPRFHSSLDKILDLVPNITRVHVYVQFDTGLRLLASNSFQSDQAPKHFELSALESGTADTYLLEEIDGQRRFAAVNPFTFKDGRPGFITVISSLSPVDELMAVHSRIRWYTLAATILLLVAAITWVFQTNIYRSIHLLIGAMNRFEQGHTEVRAREQLPGEFGDLARHLNHMLAQIASFRAHMERQIQSATDVLARRNLELESLNRLLYETQKRLHQAELLAVIGQVTATFAHEIGSPLSAVSTHLQVLLEEKGLPPQIRQRLLLADGEINRVCGIVETLLDDTRRPQRLVPVDIREVIRRVLHLLGPTLQAGRVACQVVEDSRFFWTLGNPDQLQQLFLNLLNNSLEALSGSGRIFITIRQSDPAPPGRAKFLKIELQDSGPGIPADRLEHIFEPFFTTKEFHKGTGLGLAVCREIAHHHGGRITAASVPGRGAFFTLWLPAADEPADSPPTVSGSVRSDDDTA